ncbi:Negative regulator of mitosis [Madurella mycetomatis]|uniref:Negative regulator of mitosis n=1 Tax=Madurella mycetomatis TaxID=100816 RepID=A0A175VQH0_9PEZI|nr:Negative regulator of mitosis [Madurella mycetomatis]
MASVTSLGVHQPAGLQHAIDEGILAPGAPPSSYSWEVNITSEDGREYEDEILTTDNCVLWSRGGFFRKTFSFDLEKEAVTQALLAYFPASADKPKGDGHTDNPATVPTDKPALSRALVVFLKTQAHIYFLSGASHVVHMPFEVESACAAPCGIIIQRKPRVDNTSVSLRLPKVPPNSFISSQPTPASRHPHSQSVAEFSTEGLGNPKVLPLRLSLTLENMWQTPMETGDSHWPRLVCLTDPLLELGLVVTHPDRPVTSKRRQSSTGPLFLAPSEEILHVEAVKVPRVAGEKSGDLTIAVTCNRETNMYTIWRLNYLENDDPFLGRQKQRKPKPSRRRSSMAPALASGAATPVQPSMRESFGAPLPGKKTRKSVKIDGRDKALDNALSSLDPEKGNDATRRQSRRVSSLLARADLSASQDRSTFAEQSIHGGHGGRRPESHGSQRPRMSSGYGRPSFGGVTNFNHSINSLPEAPVDDLLEELRAGGDFEGFHSMGLEDHDFDGLEHEMLLTKIHTMSMDNTNVRYSLSGKPARTQSKVFIVAGPPTAADDQGRGLLLIAIQDPVDKRLQLLTLHLELHDDRTPTKSSIKTLGDLGAFNIIPGDPKRVQSVVDSCKVSDGHEAIMILSEDKRGGRELSLQSPWGKVTTVTLPSLYLDTPNNLEDFGTRKAQGFQGHQIPRVDVTGTQIDSIRHSDSRGVVELRDKEGRSHRVRIKLQPSSPEVRKALDVCRGVLHSSYADKLLAGWWHVMQWLQHVKLRASEPLLADMEWSAAVILLLASFLVLGHNSETSLQTLGNDVLKPPAGNKWEAMHLREAPNSSARPPWMRSKAWQWLLDSAVPDMSSSHEPNYSSGDFISIHVGLAKRWMASAGGLLALGFEGYLPTALNRLGSGREIAAWSMALALHLLVEEQKLNILSSEDTSPGQTDLKAVLYQVSRWLGWKRYEAMYALGMQADFATTHDSIPFVMGGIAEPPSGYCVLTWIQGHLATGQGTEFPTLPEVYAAVTHGTHTGSLRKDLWASLTPRTMMFGKLFGLLGSSTHRFEVVAAMHKCGFTPQILETLPEAILTPLQDIISISQPNPPASWPKELLALVSRTDMNAVLRTGKTWRALGSEVTAPSHDAKWDFRMLCQHLDDFHDHTEETDTTQRQAVVRLLFREDRRLNEAQAMLSSVKNRVLRLDPRPEWTEAEYLERQKELVATMAISTLAIPVGRGLLYYALRYPLLTQKYQIGGFNLTCIVKPANNTVGVDKSMFLEEKINWAFFHQGVAGGLAISPQAKGIDTSWILYNKPGQDLSNRHAGFLLALGLNGHLKSVAKWVAFKYLTPKHTMTSIGLLLGLAASYLGTMDSLITRLLSVHVTRMLPRGSAELNLSRHTQTTGIMGIGLLYCNSQHRRMSEIMMSEIEHTDDGEEEGPLRDESYRLAAGFALGFINLGKGGDLRGLRDMRLTEKLLTIATSTKRVELVHVLDRSAAGAVMAIALIFMKSEDHIVARKIDVPDTILQFDYVRPDILLLRTVAKNIILWKEIDPTFEWIRDGLPSEYRARFQLTSITKLYSRDMPFFSILAGLCFALGLRFAGSANVKVRDLLVHYLDEFRRIVQIRAIDFDSELTRSNARMCMDLVALSCASVMAGTGDIIVLRRLRALHGRDDPSTTYGSHLAAHLAIGALFLGCGTCAFGTSNIAVAALLLSFYPLFPANVQDNRSHLQAFRHFWVLATEPRCLVAKDLVTGQPLSVPILVHLVPGSPSAIAAATAADVQTAQDEAVALYRQTPCLLPPLDDVLRVETDARALGYWDLTIDLERSPQLADDFRENQTVYLRRRPGNESTFSATLRALGSSSSFSSSLPLVLGTEVGGGAGTGMGGASAEPFEWVFGLDALKGLTRAERAVVLDRLGSDGGGVGEGEGATTAVDARLVLRNGLESWRWSRDGLLGLRLLFEWAERRGLFATSERTGNETQEQQQQQPQQAEGAAGRKRRDKGKGKKSESRKGKKKVSVGTAAFAEPGSASTQEKKIEPSGSGGMEGSWWLRDNAIEELKGQTWLAGREG